jgi:cytoskeletal protein RodZ
MILEKIRQHAGKILLLLTGVLLFVAAIVIIKHRNITQLSANLAASQQEALRLREAEIAARNEAAAIDAKNKAQAKQDTIENDRQQKLDSVANNPAIVTVQETVPVTKVIPGATRKVTVPVASSSASSKTTTTKSTPAPATKTKTS